jgi:hypothetical protein
MYEAGTDCYYKGEQVRVIANEDGYIAVRRKNGSEIEPALLKHLSMNAPVQASAQRFELSEKQANKLLNYLSKHQGEMMDRAALEYKIATDITGLSPLPWGTISAVIKIQFVAVANGTTIERLFKEYS